MTSRSCASASASTFRLSPNPENAKRGDESTKSALEVKLELLEARFTMPLDHNKQVPNQQFLNGGSTISLNNRSPETLGEDSSPAHAAHFNHTNTSQHSFGFDTPSLSFSNHSRPMKYASPVPVSNKASAAAASENPAALKAGWQDVTTAHMAKVAALQQEHQQQHQDHDNDDDEHTLITSHVRPAVCVQESPPFVLPKTMSNVADNLNNQGMVRCLNFSLLRSECCDVTVSEICRHCSSLPLTKCSGLFVNRSRIHQNETKPITCKTTTTTTTTSVNLVCRLSGTGQPSAIPLLLPQQQLQLFFLITTHENEQNCNLTVQLSPRSRQLRLLRLRERRSASRNQLQATDRAMAPAPTKANSPIVTPQMMVQLAPNVAPLLTRVSRYSLLRATIDLGL